MSLIYNPPTGATIPAFVFDGNKYHKIDNEEIALEVGEIGQFAEAVGKDMISRWGFLEEITPQRAEEIKSKPKEVELKCATCGYTFGTQKVLDKHIAEAHKKAEEVIPDIPMAATTPVEPRINTQEATQDLDNPTTGPDWYGPGLTETRGTL